MTEVIRELRLAQGAVPVDLEIDGGVIREITRSSGGGFGGRFAFPGFTDTHIHLDKAYLLGRTRASNPSSDRGRSAGLGDAVAQLRLAKREFTVADVDERARRVLCRAVDNGTTRMRSLVEVDPDAGLRSLEALLRLRSDFAARIELRLVAFAQDGTTGTPETLRLLECALRAGADEIGGCPYTDEDPVRHIRSIFDLAVAYERRVDFHVDFDLDSGWDHLSLVLDETARRRWHGRVSVGHATKLAVLDDLRRTELLGRMRELGVGLVALPATDMFLVGAVAPAGMVSAVATNNVCNPFTPFGDADLLRMANFFATVAGLATDAEVMQAWNTVTCGADALLGAPRAIRVGEPATFVVMDAEDPVTALRELRRPVAAWFRGLNTIPVAPLVGESLRVVRV